MKIGILGLEAGGSGMLTLGWRKILSEAGCLLSDGRKYSRIAENTLGWRKILSDGGKYSRKRDVYSRMAENTLGWQKILSDSGKYSRMAENTLG